jgi:membrane protein
MDGSISAEPTKPRLAERIAALRETLQTFPWADTLATLRERFREDRLGLSASSLTFTTTVSLVPLIALALAVFTAFPMFSKLQDGLQRWLIDSLMPESIARQVLSYVTQFASKAAKLGLVGLLILVVSGLALMLTIDKTLNQIWRVQRPRPLAQRVLVYWGAITLGPLILGVSVSAATWALTGSKGITAQMPGLLRFGVDALQFAMLAAACAALYHHVPNTRVRWSHAWAGGIFVAVALEIAQRLLAYYLKTVPTYSVIYGAFATVPILLVWIYLMWVIVLLGAVSEGR